MHHKVVSVGNVRRLEAAFAHIASRPQGVPGICLIHGNSGAGKTTAVAWLVNQVNGIYMRAWSVWSPNAMLSALVHELGGAPGGSNASMAAWITEQLTLRPRPVFVDEGDYVVNQARLVETLRDFHDATNVPLALIGMAGIERQVAKRQQLSRRVAQEVRFEALTSEDTALLVSQLAEVRIAPDLVGRLHQQARGNAGLVVVGIDRIEAEAKKAGLTTVTAENWGKRELFSGSAPRE